MKLNFVGTGNLTRFFLECLRGKYEFGFILSRNFDRAKSLAERYEAIPSALDYGEELEGTVFVLVPDRYIGEVSKKLKVKPNTILIHCSGFLPSTVFSREHRASLHPNFSFSNLEKALEARHEIIFGVEGDEEGVKVAVQIAKDISGRFFIVPTDRKVEYHLAAVMASNFPVAFMYLAKKIYSQLGLQDPDYLIYTLLKGVLESAKEMGVERVLTGPVKRGDWLVVEEEGRVFEKLFGERTVYDEIVTILKEVAEGERGKTEENER